MLEGKELKTWFANKFVKLFVKRIRFWEEKEWELLSPKSQIWIWYKHHWNLKNTGSGEVDLFTNPMKEAVIYGGIILVNIQMAMLLFDFQVNFIVLLALIVYAGIYLWCLNFYLQWKLGNYLDKKDLIALNHEISNRRNYLSREIRNMYKIIQKMYGDKNEK